jgi:hypothetical protein
MIIVVQMYIPRRLTPLCSGALMNDEGSASSRERRRRYIVKHRKKLI